MSAASQAREIAIPARHPVSRQILALVGNRYVVFGSQNRLPGGHILGPSDVPHPNMTRVGDEFEFPPERLIESLFVEGATVYTESIQGPDMGWDLEVDYPDHPKLLVGVKIRTRDLTRGEFEKNSAWIKSIQAAGNGEPEVWNFNIEKLRLTIMTLGDFVPGFEEIDPLNVWEFNANGSVFERSYVISRVHDWKSRVETVFKEVQAWSAEIGMKTETARTVLMAEEPMQRFAVPDQIMPVLDLSRESDYIISLVPVGLWIFGSNGRINFLTKNGTLPLIDLSREEGVTNWQLLLNKASMKFEPWGKEAFMRLVSEIEAV